jgi:membrane peptidoglycan carboxypeptidase
VPSAGKTGTTEKHADAWFAGYTPTLQTTVWVGYTRGEIPMENVHGISVSGSTFPSMIWHDFMSAAIGERRAFDFPEPKNYPVWRDFEQGREGRSFGYTRSYGYDGSDGSDEDAEEEEAEPNPPPPPPPPPPSPQVP